MFLALCASFSNAHAAGRTVVGIDGPAFTLGGRPTYPGNQKLQGLLMNARLVQGIFDDANPATRARWAYPDTGRWDPDRNTREFVAAMPSWRAHGLLAFTLNLQGGSPEGYSKKQPWRNSAFDPAGNLDPAYARRLKLILDRADQLGMVVILGYFYFGQDQLLRDEAAVRRAVTTATRWVLQRGYRNVLVEIANEGDGSAYDHSILQPPRVVELIQLVQATQVQGRRLLVSTSYLGGKVPGPDVVNAADFVLLHGNGVDDPARLRAMIDQVRRGAGFRPKPIVVNEDDHFDFDRPVNHMMAAVDGGASWGYFDPGRSDYRDGFQCPPIDWTISTPRKRAFFAALARLAEVQVP
jgi:hypothetical protein